MTEEEYLEQEVCGCGTVRELIDEAIMKVAAGRQDGKCLIWEIAAVMLIEQLQANIVASHEMRQNGGDEQKAKTEAVNLMSSCNKEMHDITEHCREYMQKRLNEALSTGSGHFH